MKEFTSVNYENATQCLLSYFQEARVAKQQHSNSRCHTSSQIGSDCSFGIDCMKMNINLCLSIMKEKTVSSIVCRFITQQDGDRIQSCHSYCLSSVQDQSHAQDAMQDLGVTDFLCSGKSYFLSFVFSFYFRKSIITQETGMHFGIRQKLLHIN